MEGVPQTRLRGWYARPAHIVTERSRARRRGLWSVGRRRGAAAHVSVERTVSSASRCSPMLSGD
eukprot:3233060-Prymnesium_polylepis.1